MKFVNYFFDWDGSLGDSLPLWFAAYKKVCGEFGIEITNRDVATKLLGDWEGPAKLGVENLEAFFQSLERETVSFLDQVKLNEGAKQKLEEIKSAGGKIAVLTTSKRKYVEGSLRNNGIIGMIDVFLGKEDVTRYKPDPQIILRALEMVNGKTANTVMIGDTGKDILAGKNAQVKTILYYPKRYREFYEEKSQLALNADSVIESFKNLE